jgi:hypothetical protein
MNRWVLSAAVLISCKRSDPPPPPPSAAPTPTPTVSVAAKPAAIESAATPPTTTPVQLPRYMRRLKSMTSAASSIYDDKKTKEKHPAAMAFDGDRRTAWVEGVDGPGQGSWVEVTSGAPQSFVAVAIDTGIQGTRPGVDLFVANAHAKKLHLRIDETDLPTVDIAATQRTVIVPASKEAKAIRVVYDDVFPGEKWADLGASEIAVLADATKVPSVPRDMIEKEVAALHDGHGVAEAKALLLRFGVAAPQDEGWAADAAIEKASLIDGRADEAVVTVTLSKDEEITHFIVLGTVNDRYVVLGTDTLNRKAEMKLERFHSAAADDVVVRFTDDKGKGLRVLSLGRGFLERIADATGAEITEGSEAPRTIEAGGVKLAFDAPSFLYH